MFLCLKKLKVVTPSKMTIGYSMVLNDFVPALIDKKKQALLLILFLLLQILVSVSILISPLMIAIAGLLFLILVGFWLSLKWEIAIGFLLFIIIFVNPPFGPRFELPYILWPQTIFYITMIILWVLQSLIGRTKYHSNISLLGFTYLLFLIVCIIGALLATFNGNPREYINADLRTVGYLMIFYLMIRVIRRKQQITILNNALFLSANALAIYTIISEIILLFKKGSNFKLIRIYGFGTDIYYQIAILTVIGLILFSGLPRRKLLLSAIAPAVALAMSLTRGYWLGLGIGLLVMFLLLSSKRQKTFMLAGAYFFCVLFIIFIFSGGLFRDIGTVVISRIFSLGQFKTDPSAAFRFLEINRVLGEFPKHPILGRGLGATLRITSPFNIFKTIEWWSIHNGYIEILHKLGILGLASYLALSFSFFRAGILAFRKTNEPYLKGTVAGVIASFASILITSFTSGVIFRVDTAVYIGIIFGIVEYLSTTKMNAVDAGMVGIREAV